MMSMLLPTIASSDQPGHTEQVEQWRAQRLESLQRPNGWLTLVGLHWLDPGEHTIGRDAGNDVVLATGPARLGRVVLTDGTVRFTASPDAGVTIDGAPAAGEVALASDSAEKPSVVVFADGDASLQLIERGGRLGLRVRDANAATRRDFAGLSNYPIDASWRFDARFDAHPPGQTIEIANVLGMLEPNPNPGAVVFTHQGQEFRLEAVDEGDGRLFLIFADRTNGRETYGAGRFVYADAPVDGRTVVDFNRAYNPPCAFNAYSTCPLPPPENRLDVAITAGELKYAGPTH
jgi:uncharacterized protein